MNTALLSCMLALMLMLSSCRKVTIHRNLAALEQAIVERGSIVPEWQYAQHTEAHYQELITTGLTIIDAVAIALYNNPYLQAALAEIGMAKADLVQAGLFTNPRLETIISFPQSAFGVESIVTQLMFTVSDLWLVPLKVNVAQEQLAIITFNIMQLIIDTIYDTRDAFITVQYASEYVNLTNRIAQHVRQVRDSIKQSKTANALDEQLALVYVNEWEARRAQARGQLASAIATLRNLLNVDDPGDPVVLDTIPDTIPPVPDLRDVRAYAMATRPEILVAHHKIAHARRTISLERGKVLDNVTLGVLYERDFFRAFRGVQPGIGPAFGIDIPLFDRNQGGIARAKFSHEQAKKLLVAAKNTVTAQVDAAYAVLRAAKDQLIIYNKRIGPLSEQVMSRAQKELDNHHMDAIEFLYAYTSLFDIQRTHLDIRYAAARAFIELERAVGRSLVSH